MKDLDTFFTDATCYESDMRYPTDQKLLWECNEKAYLLMCMACQPLGIHHPRPLHIISIMYKRRTERETN